MVNTVMFDFSGSNVVFMSISNTGYNDQNFVNLIFRTGETTCNLEIAGENLENPVRVTGFAANSICFYKIPEEYYPSNDYITITFYDEVTRATPQIFYFTAPISGGFMSGRKATAVENRFGFSWYKPTSTEAISQDVANIETTVNNLQQTLPTQIQDTSNTYASQLGGVYTDEVITNLMPYFLHTDYTYNKVARSATKNSDNMIAIGNMAVSRNAVSIDSDSVNFVSGNYPQGHSYTKSECTAVKIGGKQLYYTAINGCNNQPYTSFTFSNPSNVWGGLTISAEAFTVYVPTKNLTTNFAIAHSASGETIGKTYFDENSGVSYPMQIKFVNGTSETDGGGIFYTVPWVANTGYECKLRPYVLASSTEDTAVENAPEGSLIFVGAVD